MVYCWKCGAENEGQSTHCKGCGTNLRTSLVRTQFEHRSRSGRGLSLGGIFFGILIMIIGFIWLSEGQITWLQWSRVWPILVVLFGVFIIIRASLK